MKRLRSLFGLLAFLASVLVCVLSVGLFVIERTGYLADFINRTLAVRIAQRLPSHPLTVSVGDARIHWSKLELVMSNIECRLDPAMAEPLRMDSVAVRLRPTLDLRRAARSVAVRGGDARISAELLERVDQIIRELGGSESDSPGTDPPSETLDRALAALPSISVRNMLIHPEWLAELGASRAVADSTLSLDLSLLEGDGGRKRLTGKAQPRGDLAGDVPTSVYLWGEPLNTSGFGVHLQTRGLELFPERFMDSELRARVPLELQSFQLQAAADLEYRWDDPIAWNGSWLASLSCPRVDWRASDEFGITDVDLRAAGRFALASGQLPIASQDWELRLTGSGAWDGMRLNLGGLGGAAAGATYDLRAWLDARDVALDLDRWKALGLRGRAADIATGIGPQGRVDLSLGVRVPRGRQRAERTLMQRAELVAHVEAAGEASAAWYGLPNADGERDGVPYRWDSLVGDVVAGFAVARPHMSRLGIGPLSGRRLHAGASAAAPAPAAARVEATGWLAPLVPGPGPGRLDIDIAARNIPLDDALEKAVGYLRGGDEIWRDYAPTAGTLDADVRVWGDPTTRGPTASIEIKLHSAALAWEPAPVPLFDGDGRIDILFDRVGQPYIHPSGNPAVLRNLSVFYDLTARAATVPHVRATGLLRREVPPDFVAGEAYDPARFANSYSQTTRVVIQSLPVRGTDFAILGQTWPAVSTQTRELGLSGSADVTFEGSQGAPRAPYHSTIVAQPKRLSGQPARFPLVADRLQGTLGISLTSPYVPVSERATTPPSEPASETTLLFLGRLFNGAPVATWAHLRSDEPDPTHVFVTGLRPGHPTVRGALTAALRQPASPGEEPTRLDLSTLATTGAADVYALLEPGPTPADPGEPTVRVYMRRNDLASDGRVVHDLEGTFEHRDRVLRADFLTGRLGSKPVRLERVFLTTARFLDRVPGRAGLLGRPGFLDDLDSLVFQADVSSVDFPLDREHLSAFINSPELGERLDALSLRGEVDIDQLRTVVTVDTQGRSKAALEGQIFPHNVSMSAGFDYKGLAGRFDLQEMIFEDESVRGWAQVDGLAMRVAGREITDASTILSYVDGRLTLDDLDAKFARSGTLRSPGIGSAGSKAIAVDVAEPFHFEVALSLDNIEVDALLKDLFAGTFENAGKVAGQFRVEGSLDDILGIQGSGWFDIQDAKLWSVPMASAFFSRFGAGDVTDFDSLRHTWQLEDGRFLIEGIRLKSNLLSIEGSGHLDLGGSMGFDLRISYSVLRYLGPLEFILYLIQDSLLSVAIRGTFHRPRILVQNFLVDLLFPPDEELQFIPLPPLADVPSRF